VTTTVQRQRELYLSRIGLKAFRINVERRRNERKDGETMNTMIHHHTIGTKKTKFYFYLLD
jgi:hypothetical protein